ncbi:DUF2971 domain-containing protein [Aeromonas hydrophila]|uniref:DUF2971 domain-containing protein n=1 Tax=Aeromonas hydrophila TaxID=644 RepID=UPI00259DC932|nr:DUF2971 domain-containing protein [Aeromonas hydrophila]MDM5117132.1 DUF2971 domain-containing protein [Aeromonas hydrophila]
MKPTPKRLLTRYITFTKLISVLEHGLFIPKATLFEDELEGILYYFNEKSNINHVISRESIRMCMDWIYISCWHLDEHECHAMWKIYGSSSESIAIQTTEIDFKIAYFSSEINMHSYFDNVKYNNPTISNVNTASQVNLWKEINPKTHETTATYAALLSFMKHAGFSFEKEARLIAIDPNANSKSKNTRTGICISNIESQKMIKRILINPYAPKWFEDLVIEIISNRYNLQIPVYRSTLAEG